MKAKIVLCISFLFATTVLWSAETDKDKMIREIIEVSGLGKQIEQYPAIVIAQVRNQQKDMASRGIDAEEYRKLLDAVQESFRAELFYKQIYDRLSSDFNQEHAQTVLDWISSPLAMKMAALEIEATSVEAMTASEAFADQMAAAPPSRRRLELVQRLDRATGSTEHNIEMSLAVTEAMLRVLTPLLPGENQMSDSQIQSMLESQRRQMKRDEPASQIAFLFTYRSVTDDELSKYIEGYESEAGAWMNQIVADSLKEAMVSAAANTARRLAGSVA